MGIPGLDPGIAEAVEILRTAGVETFESCQGGEGHAYPEPTVRFSGQIAAGWHALGVCLDYGLPVHTLRRIWSIDDYAPTGPYWEVVFRAGVTRR